MSKTVDEAIDELCDQLSDGFDENVMRRRPVNNQTANQNLEDLLRHPLFLDHNPTEKEIDESMELQALQAIVYDKSDPHEYALALKMDGNQHFKKRDYKKAITVYTEALKQKHGDTTLKAVVLTNRAASHFHLGNNRSSLIDASCTVKIKPDHMKAIIRAAMCCYDMEKYADAISWCDKGLQIDSKEKKLLEMKKKALNQQKQKERDERKRELKGKKDLEFMQAKIDAIKIRGVNLVRNGKLVNLDDVEAFRDALPTSGSGPHSGKVYLDDQQVLHWPVYFIYPEFNQSDFIQDFCEDARFIDHLEVMFTDENMAEWDTEKQYRLQYLKIYMDNVSEDALLEIPPEETLRKVLSDSRCVVREGCASFTIISTQSQYFQKLLQRSTIQHL